MNKSKQKQNLTSVSRTKMLTEAAQHCLATNLFFIWIKLVAKVRVAKNKRKKITQKIKN